MKRLAKYLRGYVKESVLGPLFKLCEATLELIVPLIIAAIIDNGIGGSDTGYILRSCLILILMGAVGLGFSVTAQYFSARASVGFVTRIREALFRKTQELSYSDLDGLGTSTLITRMTSDADKVQSGLNLTLRLLLRSPFVVFGAMIMAFTIDFEGAMTFVAVIPLLSIVVFGIMLITMPMYKRVQHGNDGILKRTRENLIGARVIRAFRLEDEETAAFEADNSNLTRVQRRVGRISALMNPMTYVIINIGIIVLIRTGALRVEAGELTQGEVIALYNYMSQILVELVKLANLIISISKALASASRIADVLDIQSTEISGRIKEKGEYEYAIEMTNVSLRYTEGADPALMGVSLKARMGEVIGIIGGTGSGKSSLVSLIPGFYTATEGEVRVFGREVSEYDPEYLRSLIGIAPQRAVLFKGTVRSNLTKRADAADGELYSALSVAQARDFVMEKGGLDAEVEEGGSNLSGGQRQRLTVARALVGSPEIVILDDSASALDFATDAAMRESIKNMEGERVTVIVSQRASSIMHADRIVVLDEGEAVGIGRHEELLRDCEVYREIYASQFEKGGDGNA